MGLRTEGPCFLGREQNMNDKNAGHAFQNGTMHPLNRRLLALISLGAASVAQAQLIEDVDVRREGSNAVVQVRFVTPVQFRRSTSARANDLTQAFYDVLPTRDVLSLVPAQRRLAAQGGLPEITVTDEAVGRAELSRRLIIRLGSAARFTVRAGKGNRTIELVLDGLGEAVKPPAPAAAQPLAEPGRRYFITLLSSVEPNLQLDTPIPATLQAYQVFTTQRDIAGRPRHEVNIGYFATQQEADSALQLLGKRFPAAVIGKLPDLPSPLAAAPGTPDAAMPAAAVATTVEVEAQAAALFASAKAAAAAQDFALALDQLNQLQNLPPNAASREAQRLAGQLRLQVGDTVQARAEYELFLKLYPSGADADAVRAELARLPGPTAADTRQRAAVEPSSTVSGSVSQFYYGGQSKVRSQEFQDSVLGGLPEVASDSTLSGTDQKQWVTGVDLNWRYRDTEQDMRFVFRDNYTADRLRTDRTRNRLSALYFDHKSYSLGTNVRIGRQSPAGGGVLGRFDGATAGYAFAPKWRINAVAGVPTDELLDSKRHFYGGWIDAEALTPQLGASVYAIQQVIDGAVDRRGLGTELRYFTPGVSAFGVLDYDQLARGLNIASLQGTWQSEGGTTVNFLYDRRTTPMLMLGNALFFQQTRFDPNDPTIVLPPATRLSDLLSMSSLEALRRQVKSTTAYTTQGLLGVTTPVTANWQLGTDVRLTNVGALLPVPEILPNGAPGTGNLWSLGFQAIGTNLYSVRDTHVFSITALHGPFYDGRLLSYNNSSQVAEFWQLEPSLRYYTQSDNAGVKTTRWTPGLRVSYRVIQQVSIESEFNTEFSKTRSPMRDESARRSFYYLGGRYDF